MSSTSPAAAASYRSWLIEHALVFVLGAALMAWAYGGWTRPDNGVPGNDSFYHIKMASLMPQATTLRHFPWLQFSYFTDRGDSFVGHHYGFHLLLSPFVHASQWLTGSYLPGGRWGVCVFFGFLALVMHRLATLASTPWRWIWLPLFALLPFQFFIRHAFVRAMTPSLVFMLLITLFMFQRKYVLLAASIAVYIHLYMGGVAFAPLIVAAYVLSFALCGGDRRTMIGLTAWSLGAWVIGIVTHPYRDGMWDFLRLQVLGSGLSPNISVGKEWKPYTDVWWFTQMCGPLLGAWIGAIVVRLRIGTKLNAEELALLVLNVAFFMLTAKARRFIEYWPVFCLLSAIFLARPMFEHATSHPFGRFGSWLAGFVSRQSTVLAVAAAALVVALTPQWRSIRADAKCKFNLAAIQSAMDFIRERSQPGEIVFTDDWDIFPVFFYYNSHNYYVVGLDPIFTHTRRPDLWARYVKITRGQTPAEEQARMPDSSSRRLSIRLTDIRDHFGAKWVVTDRDHRALAAELAAATEFAELVYPSRSYEESKEAPYLVFRVR